MDVQDRSTDYAQHIEYASSKSARIPFALAGIHFQKKIGWDGIRIWWLSLFLGFGLLGCVSEQVPQCNQIAEEQLHLPAAYILCEGLWKYDNSTLSRFDLTTATVYNEFFQKQNCQLRLGDTGNDMALLGDTLFIAITESRTIEQLNAQTGQWLNRLELGDAQPRHLCILDTVRGYVTILNQDKVIEFNPATMEMTGRSVAVGPAPEEIATDGRYLYVVNSGYGDFRTTEPGANTLSVIDPTTMTEIQKVPLPPNPTMVTVGNGIIFIGYYHLPSLKDSIGGIVALDQHTLQVVGHWKIAEPVQLWWDSVSQQCFVLSDTALYVIQDSLSVVLSRQSSPYHHWYAMAVSPLDGSIWIADAKDFVSPGEILVFAPNQSSPTFSFEVGLNPGDICFVLPAP